jgi:hypothetical protein
MKKYGTKLIVFCFALLLLAVTNIAIAQEEQPPDNVAGNWTIYSKGANGETATQYIELKQEGNVLTGHFKGPHQSGRLEGSMNVHHILFRTKTREVLTFRGRVEGNTISGTFHTRAGTGEWNAVRSN